MSCERLKLVLSIRLRKMRSKFRTHIRFIIFTLNSRTAKRKARQNEKQNENDVQKESLDK
jgi:hypothetical protein